METFNIFWTGGFDSTYRICEILAGGKGTVRPVYLIDKGRRSFLMELSAMVRLREAVSGRFNRGPSLMPLEVYLKEDFPPCDEIRKSFAAIKAAVHIGTQYEWLAQFSRDMSWKYGKIELCTQRHNPPAGWQLEVFDNPHSQKPCLNEGHARCLFEHYLFPTLHLTKSDMKLNALKMGFYDIIRDTWFCHRPVGGLACGACRPCNIARAEREDIRFAFLGRERMLMQAACRKLGDILKGRSGRGETAFLSL